MKQTHKLIVVLLLIAPLEAATSISAHQDKGDKAGSHPRLKKEVPEGQRYKLAIGTLFLPKGLKRDGKVPLFFCFHGGDWLPEVAAVQHGNTAVISVQLGQGSAVYAKPFADPKAFGELIKDAEKKAGVEFGPITLTGWSAGYGAIRAILKNPDYYQRIQGVLLLDGMHASYVADPAAKGPAKILPEHVDIFLQWAKDAVAGKKRFFVTHTQIVPGTYASTTETADYILHGLQLKRQDSRKVGPMLMQQLTEVRAGQFVLIGYAGDTAADHIDILHGLPKFLKWVHVVQ